MKKAGRTSAPYNNKEDYIMRKRVLSFLVKGYSKAKAYDCKYTSLGYFCWLSVYRNEYHYDPEEMVYRFHIRLGE